MLVFTAHTKSYEVINRNDIMKLEKLSFCKLRVAFLIKGCNNFNFIHFQQEKMFHWIIFLLTVASLTQGRTFVLYRTHFIIELYLQSI